MNALIFTLASLLTLPLQAYAQYVQGKRAAEKIEHERIEAGTAMERFSDFQEFKIAYMEYPVACRQLQKEKDAKSKAEEQRDDAIAGDDPAHILHLCVPPTMKNVKIIQNTGAGAA